MAAGGAGCRNGDSVKQVMVGMMCRNPRGRLILIGGPEMGDNRSEFLNTGRLAIAGGQGCEKGLVGAGCWAGLQARLE